MPPSGIRTILYAVKSYWLTCEAQQCTPPYLLHSARKRFPILSTRRSSEPPNALSKRRTGRTTLHLSKILMLCGPGVL